MTINTSHMTLTTQMANNLSEHFNHDKYSSNSVVTAACLIVIAVIAFGGNLLVLVSIGVNRNLRSSADILLANLAVADLGQAVVSIPLRVMGFLRADDQETSLIPCGVVTMFSILFGGASNINILLVTIDRFAAIRWPFRYSTCSTARIFITIVAVSWLYLFLLAILPLVGWGQAENVAPSPTCRFTLTLSRDYLVTCYILVHGISLTTIIVLYIFILKAALRHSRAIAAQEFCLRATNTDIDHHSITNEDLTTKGEQNLQTTRGLPFQRMRLRNSNKRSRGARMIAVLVGVFIVLVLPIILIDMIELWRGPSVPPAVINVTICMIYANSGINVFIYGGWNSEYRRTFRLVFASVWNFMRRPCSSSRIELAGGVVKSNIMPSNEH